MSTATTSDIQARHCCEDMTRMVTHQCDQHPDPMECPDFLISYSPTFDQYGLVIHDGSHSIITISYCPFCGEKLPKDRSDDWFDQLEALGFDDPFDQNIPEKFKSAAWRQKQGD